MITTVVLAHPHQPTCVTFLTQSISQPPKRPLTTYVCELSNEIQLLADGLFILEEETDDLLL